MSRRKAREFAFKVLFQVDQVDTSPREAFDYLLKETTLQEKDCNFSWELITGCIERLQEIDKILASYSTEWKVERMSSVDRNILRIASYEILFHMDSQAVVAINEAIEISKKYGGENSASFINAILDKVMMGAKK